MMNQYFPSRWAWVSRLGGIIAGVGALFLTASASQAQVVITGFYNQVGTDFFYNFEVANNSGADVTLINVLFPVLDPPVITGESAPPEYSLTYSTGSLVFTGDPLVPFPDGTTVGGFSLTSNVLLTPDSLEAFDPGLNPVTATFNNVAVTVPETGTLPLVVLAGSALFGTVTARRRTVARP